MRKKKCDNNKNILKVLVGLILVCGISSVAMITGFGIFFLYVLGGFNVISSILLGMFVSAMMVFVILDENTIKILVGGKTNGRYK